MPPTTPLCDFGWKAPLTLADPNGTSHNLDGLMGEKELLVAFICNHCPYVVAVIDRLVADAAALQADGVTTVAIMSNDYATYTDDSPDGMLDFAASTASAPILSTGRRRSRAPGAPSARRISSG